MLAGAAGAHAATLTYYVDIFSGNPAQLTLPTGTGVPTQSTANAGPATVLIPQFDRSDPNPNHIFSLTSVTFTLLESSIATATVLNVDNSGTTTTATAALCFAAGGDHWVSGTNGCTGVLKTDTFSGLNATMPLSVTMDVFPFVSVLSTDTTSPNKSGVAAKGHYSTFTNVTASVCSANGGFNWTSANGGTCFLPLVVAGQTSFSGLTASGSNSTSITSFLGLFESLTPGSISFDALVGDIGVQGTQNTSNGSVSFTGSGTAGGIFEVQYNFTEIVVPEPASMVLIGSSILTIGLLLRRKQRGK